MANELYLTLIYRPAAGAAAGLLARLLARAGQAEHRRERATALETCEKLAQTLRASLARYEPEPLGVYRDGPRWYSALLEFLALLVNGDACRVPLPGGPLAQALPSSRRHVRERSDRVPLAGRHAGRGAARHQGVPDPDRRRHVQPAAVGAVLAGAHPVIHLSLARRRRRRCCSGSSTAWRTRGTSPSRRRRSSKMRSMALPATSSPWAIITSRCRCWRSSTPATISRMRGG